MQKRLCLFTLTMLLIASMSNYITAAAEETAANTPIVPSEVPVNVATADRGTDRYSEEIYALVECIRGQLTDLSDRGVYLHSLANNGRKMTWVVNEAPEGVEPVSVSIEEYGEMLNACKSNKPAVADREYLIAFYLSIREMYEGTSLPVADSINDRLTETERNAVTEELQNIEMTFYCKEEG